MSHDVFVSYSSRDNAVADAVVASLEQNGIRCWYAPRDVKPSEDWGRANNSAIETSRIMLVIFSANSNRSQRVLDELNVAISEELTILPFRIENLEPDGALRLHLTSRHWLDAYDPSWEMYIRDLIRTVSSNLEISLSRDEIEVPEDLPGKKVEKRKGKGVYILAGLVGAALLAAAVWYGLSGIGLTPPGTSGASLTQTEEAAETERLSLEATRQAREETCRIIFLSTRTGDPTLWLMGRDGSSQTQLSYNTSDSYADWSPDAAQIVFNSGRDGDNEIYIMNSNGSNIRQLTDHDRTDMAPAWSPDGETIAFYSDRDGDLEIYTMDVNGSNLTQLTTEHGVYGNYEYTLPLVRWSPDNEKIVFSSDRDGDLEIFSMDLNDGSIIQLTSNDALEQFPEWSPDGEQIVFTSDRYGDDELFLMDADGSNVRQLTSNNGLSVEPDWAPDGSQIAFASNRDGNFEIWVVDADGSNPQKLTDTDADEFLPLWSPLCE